MDSPYYEYFYFWFFPRRRLGAQSSEDAWRLEADTVAACGEEDRAGCEEVTLRFIAGGWWH